MCCYDIHGDFICILRYIVAKTVAVTSDSTTKRTTHEVDKPAQDPRLVVLYRRMQHLYKIATLPRVTASFFSWRYIQKKDSGSLSSFVDVLSTSRPKVAAGDPGLDWAVTTL